MPHEDPEYDNAIKRLEKFSVGKMNDRVELEIFRSLKQKPDETFKNFLLRLRTQVERREFNDREDKEIFQQITMTAKDEKVRDKGLENNMDLNDLTNYANNRELLIKQKEKAKPFASEEVLETSNQREGGKSSGHHRDELTRSYSARPAHSWGASRSTDNPQRRFGPGRPRVSCQGCGSWNHDSNSQSCPARRLRCHQCGHVGHYARKCPNRRQNQ